MNLKTILEYHLFSIGEYNLTLAELIGAFLVLFMAKIIMWIIGGLLRQYFKRKKLDSGRRFAIQQFLKYIVYTIALLLAFEALGIKISVLWGGAAALLVGIGLGLQQTFNDLISGVILLIEGSVEVDDIVEVNGLVGRVESIGLRTSKVETRDRISILIPNSKLVGDSTINWTHNDAASRFQVYVGVAYSSDIDLVTKLILTAADRHEKVLKDPPPRVQFKDFGNSSLDFTLNFFTHEYLGIEFVKSELRYAITKLFREHKVEIPFPQRDLWLRNAEDLKSVTN